MNLKVAKNQTQPPPTQSYQSRPPKRGLTQSYLKSHHLKPNCYWWIMKWSSPSNSQLLYRSKKNINPLKSKYGMSGFKHSRSYPTPSTRCLSRIMISVESYSHKNKLMSKITNKIYLSYSSCVKDWVCSYSRINLCLKIWSLENHSNFWRRRSFKPGVESLHSQINLTLNCFKES